MSEIASVYHLNNKDEAHSIDRKHFYDEQIEVFKKEGKPSRAIGIFDVILFTERKEVILQKRSHNKRHNPYLIDKTVGGHMQFGDSPYYTAMVETVQELRVPSVVLRKEEDFKRTFKILDNSLESTAIIELVDHNIYHIDNIMDGEPIKIAKNIWMFIGIYSGAIKPVDREVTGILYYEMNVLKDEMKRMPELFTPDLHFMLNKYQKDIDRILKILD